MNDMTPVAMRDRLVELPLAELKPWPGNARTHTKKQIRQIADSIERFGYTNPVLIDSERNILVGHGRVEALKLLGRTHVETLDIGVLSEADRRAYILADNRLAELAGWDEALLAAELGGILDLDPDFDIAITGFSPEEVEAALNAAAAEVIGAEEIVEPDPDAPVVSRRGDMWVMGDHRLLCGDARNTADIDRLMGGERAQMVVTDPPFNVRVNGHICGLGSVKHDEFVMASGEMSRDEFRGFLVEALGQLARVAADGSIHFVCMDWRHIADLIAAGEAVYDEFKNLIVWNKDNGGMGAFYRSKHELIAVFKKGAARHINNFGLGQHGRYRTNVWDYPGVNSLHATRGEELAMHPTVKPIALVADAMLDCSRRNGIVLDTFSGSGTTIMAAERTGRRARALELDPRYVDVAVRRWERETGRDAVLAGTDTTFTQLEQLVAELEG